MGIVGSVEIDRSSFSSIFLSSSFNRVFRCAVVQCTEPHEARGIEVTQNKLDG